MSKYELEKQRLFSIVAYCDEVSPVQARVIYLNEHGDIPMQQVHKLMSEMADDGTLVRPRKGIYRRAK